MMPAHGGFDLRRDHGFRNPPFLPFQVPGERVSCVASAGDDAQRGAVCLERERERERDRSCF